MPPYLHAVTPQVDCYTCYCRTVRFALHVKGSTLHYRPNTHGSGPFAILVCAIFLLLQANTLLVLARSLTLVRLTEKSEESSFMNSFTENVHYSAHHNSLTGHTLRRSSDLHNTWTCPAIRYPFLEVKGKQVHKKVG